MFEVPDLIDSRISSGVVFSIVKQAVIIESAVVIPQTRVFQSLYCLEFCGGPVDAEEMIALCGETMTPTALRRALEKADDLLINNGVLQRITTKKGVVCWS